MVLLKGQLFWTCFIRWSIISFLFISSSSFPALFLNTSPSSPFLYLYLHPFLHLSMTIYLSHNHHSCLSRQHLSISVIFPHPFFNHLPIAFSHFLSISLPVPISFSICPSFSHFQLFLQTPIHHLFHYLVLHLFLHLFIF